MTLKDNNTKNTVIKTVDYCMHDVIQLSSYTNDTLTISCYDFDVVLSYAD